MEQVTDITGTALVEGDIVTVNSDGSGATYKVRSVQSGEIGLVTVAPHGLRHGRRGVRLLMGSEVTRLADEAPAVMHRDGLVAFG